jgi:hypothetical protein
MCWAEYVSIEGYLVAEESSLRSGAQDEDELTGADCMVSSLRVRGGSAASAQRGRAH